ncbi:MAG TPA: AAA family ATPase [Marmoricola sp.]|nr:AAA family ATPase [Marmoricola sp.]
MSTEAANRTLDDALTTGPRCGRSRVIAIDGHTGTGKTTLAEEIRAAAGIRGLSFAVVHTDELCPGWGGLPEVPRIVEELLEHLAHNAEASYPTWDWHAAHPGPDAIVSPADVIVIEGVGAGARGCVRFFSARVRLDAPVDVRKKRALDRDGDTFAPYWDTWAQAEARYFAEEWSQDAAHDRIND